MRRREFITLLASVAAWPLAARAQQSAKMPAIGVLSPGRPEPPDSLLDMVNAFLQGLQGLGYIEGRIITVERQFAQWQQARLRELAADLVARKVVVLVATIRTVIMKGAQFRRALADLNLTQEESDDDRPDQERRSADQRKEPEWICESVRESAGDRVHRPPEREKMIIAEIIVLLVIATLPHAMALFWYLGGKNKWKICEK
jgi:hypothetical protein